MVLKPSHRGILCKTENNHAARSSHVWAEERIQYGVGHSMFSMLPFATVREPWGAAEQALDEA